MKRFLSLGAGVQSSTLALMIARGELPMVDAAIFADTQWEPRSVYDWLAWLEMQLPFPVHRVTAGSIRDSIIAKQNSTGGRFASVPWHIIGHDGGRGMGRRQCTREFKLDPITRKKRDLVGLVPRQRAKDILCETLIGISLDEAVRMKPSRERWNVNSWPLIDFRMTRADCLRWMERHGYPTPPKSSCIGCPYHSDHEWRVVKADPAAWVDVLEIDALIREPVRRMRGQQFMHRSCKPLAEVDLTTAEERGQVDMFNNECEGMCGT